MTKNFVYMLTELKHYYDSAEDTWFKQLHEKDHILIFSSSKGATDYLRNRISELDTHYNSAKPLWSLPVALDKLKSGESFSRVREYKEREVRYLFFICRKEVLD